MRPMYRSGVGFEPVTLQSAVTWLFAHQNKLWSTASRETVLRFRSVCGSIGVRRPPVVATYVIDTSRCTRFTDICLKPRESRVETEGHSSTTWSTRDGREVRLTFVLRDTVSSVYAVITHINLTSLTWSCRKLLDQNKGPQRLFVKVMLFNKKYESKRRHVIVHSTERRRCSDCTLYCCQLASEVDANAILVPLDELTCVSILPRACQWNF